jgi:hypothetical protein
MNEEQRPRTENRMIGRDRRARRILNHLEFHVISCYDSNAERHWRLAMKPRLFPLLLLCFTLLALPTVSISAATDITFDDLSETGTGSFIASGYQGLVWSNFVAENAIIFTAYSGLTGYYYGLVSGSNNAFNAFGNPAEIDSTGTNFNFFSAYLTGAWRSNLNIEVQGFSGANLLYDQTVVASATNPTLFAFNYLDINRLTFNSFGGLKAGFLSDGENFVMDNLSFEFVPEPSSLLLTACGVLTLWAFVRRKRA